MNKCEHGKAIEKFCLFEHCQSKQSGGCQDCIKKHHNHIGQISFLNQEEVKAILKKFQIQANYRPKSRSLQQCIFNFFAHIKANVTLNLDLVCKNLINQIGYPYLQKNGTLNCYKRLKNKQYRKVSQKELKQIFDLFKMTEGSQILREEKRIYAEAVDRIQVCLEKVQKNIKDTFDNLFQLVINNKQNLTSYDRTFYLKINEIFKQIKKYPNIHGQKKPQAPIINKETQTINKQISIMKKSINKGQEKSIDKKKLRDVSLDREIKIQNKLKTYPKSKTQQKQKYEYGKPEKVKETNQFQNQIKEIPKKNLLRENQLLQNKEPIKDQKQKKIHKLSEDFKSQDILLRPPNKAQKDDFAFNDFSQKEEQILQRKKKLLDLMSLKPAIKKQSTQLNNDNIDSGIPQKNKQFQGKQILNPNSKDVTQSDRLNSVSLALKPIKIQKKINQNPVTSFMQLDKISSKRPMTQILDEQQQKSTTVQQRQKRNETVMSSSQTQTEQLFNANINIPIDDIRQQEQFEISEESVQKCIVVPEVDILAKQILTMHSECQSPLLLKKKQIETFSALIKLAESKYLQESPKDQNKDNRQVNQTDQSSIRINRILYSEIKDTATDSKTQQNKANEEKNVNEDNLKDSKRSITKSDSAEIDENQKKSLALLLQSLNYPGSQGIPYLQKAIQYSPNNLSAAQYLSFLYLQAERPQDCLKLCNDILRFISSSETNDLALRLNINKSAALNHLGRYSECITFLERCLRHRHNDLIYKNLADAYCSIGILQKAIYNYEHAIIQNSSNTQAHYNLAVCHYQQQNYYNASIYIEKALKHHPNNQIYKEMKKHVDQKILASPVL